MEEFVRLYNGSREGRFGAVVREVYGTDLDALEAEFWEDVRGAGRRDGGGTCPRRRPPKG